MNDWYERRLAQIAGQRPGAPQQPARPPAQPLLPGQLPPHLAPYATPQAAPPQTPQAFTGAQPGQQPQRFISYDANTGVAVDDDGTVALLYNSAVQTGGSKSVREHSAQCPNCNGSNYFTLMEGGVFSKAAGGTVNAMQCADCGYPKVQAGSQGGALGTARSSGPARKARQLPADHRVTVQLPGGGEATFEPPGGR